MLIDTHTHLYLPEFDGDEGSLATVRRAVDAGVGKMIFPNVDLTTVEPMKQLHRAAPDVTYMAMGFHPTEVNERWRDSLAQIRSELDTAPSDYVAIGEIGIDLYWDKTFADGQMQALEAQMQWAREFGLPVILHCREGLDPMLEVLQEFPDVRGVMHSFGGTVQDVERIRRVGDYYFGINGIVTFKNSRLHEVLPAIGLERMLLETDSPYLAPVPHRGKRNESSYIVHTVARIAQSLMLTDEKVADVTTANARILFDLR
jgi:hydrolase, tatD family